MNKTRTKIRKKQSPNASETSNGASNNSNAARRPQFNRRHSSVTAIRNSNDTAKSKSPKKNLASKGKGKGKGKGKKNMSKDDNFDIYSNSDDSLDANNNNNNGNHGINGNKPRRSRTSLSYYLIEKYIPEQCRAHDHFVVRYIRKYQKNHPTAFLSKRWIQAVVKNWEECNEQIFPGILDTESRNGNSSTDSENNNEEVRRRKERSVTQTATESKLKSRRECMCFIHYI